MSAFADGAGHLSPASPYPVLILVDDPEPGAVALAAGDLAGHLPVRPQGPGQRQVAVDHRRHLLAHIEFTPGGAELGEEGADRGMAADQPALGIVPLGRIDDGLGLEQGDHALNVALVLPGDQQALQILRIPRRLAGLNAHDHAPWIPCFRAL